jgi:hypothetical protein
LSGISGRLNLLEPQGHVQASNGTALPFTIEFLDKGATCNTPLVVRSTLYVVLKGMAMEKCCLLAPCCKFYSGCQIREIEMGGKRDTYGGGVWWGKHEGKNHLVHLGVDVRIILKRILN